MHFLRTHLILFILCLLSSVIVIAEEIYIDKETLDNVDLDDLPEGESINYNEAEKQTCIKIDKPVKRKKELPLYKIGDCNTVLSKKEWKPIDSQAPCHKKLAGHGKRARAICFDMIHIAARGPLMVVIPINNDFPEHFAINKYEVSYQDFSKYCILSGDCKPEKERALMKMPLINITIEDIHGYVKWLSDRTGYKYRLPTPKEWEYAARSNGISPKDLNCAVDINIKKVIGAGVTSVITGHDNEWGLRNALGNVEEFVEDKNGDVFSIGGTYLERCRYDLKPMKKDSRSGLTGFRLVREM